MAMNRGKEQWLYAKIVGLRHELKQDKSLQYIPSVTRIAPSFLMHEEQHLPPMYARLHLFLMHEEKHLSSCMKSTIFPHT